MLEKGVVSKSLFSALISSNNGVVLSTEEGIRNFCNLVESVVYEAIKSATIKIPPGVIQTQGQGVQSNSTLLILENSIQ